MRLSTPLLAATLLITTTSCAVGPDFERPAKPETLSYESSTLPGQTEGADESGGDSQKFVPGKDISATWWELYHSDALNKLIEKALQKNPDLAAADASLRMAQESTLSGEAVFLPTIEGSFSTSRQKTAGASGGGNFPGRIYTLHNATVGASYDLDIFGGNRRALEALEAQEEYQQYQLRAARITLTSNIVTAAIQEASLRGQIDATEKVIASQNRQYGLLQKQLELGAIAKPAVLAQEALLSQTRATLPPLEKQLAQTRHLLSVLAGQVPSEEVAGRFELSSLKLPDTLPVILPADLVEQRPDVRAAEANLHAASAAIGVAAANRLPKFMLSANIGDVANNLGKMFSPGTGIWSMGFDATQTIFDAGALAHKQGTAEAQYDFAVAQYRKTVLAALQDVADTLRALQSDAQSLKAQRAASRAATGSLVLAHDQYTAGAIPYSALLDAERTEQQTKIARVQAEAQRYADTAALFQALGGGWWNQKAEGGDQKMEDSAPKAPDEKPQTIQGWKVP